MLHEKLQKQVPAWTVLAAIGGMLLLFVIGSGLYNSGWTNGLSIGLLAGGGEGAKLLTNQGYGLHRGLGHVGFFGGILHFFFFIFVVSMIFRVLGFMRWKMQHHMHNHGPMHGNGEKSSEGQPWGGPPWANRHPQWQQPQPPQQPAEGNIPITPSEDKPQNTSWVV